MSALDLRLTPHRVAADLVRPSDRLNRQVWNIGLILAGSLLVAASARIALPLPFTPVPISMQTFAVLLVGALLGPRRGAAAMVAYLLEGAAGLPVFVNGGGAHHLIGPTGGYLAAFVPAAAIVGALARRGWDRRIETTIAAMTIGTAIILLVGTAWLAVVLQSPEAAIAAGLLPFLPGAVIKIAMAAVVLPLAWSWLGRFESRNDVD